MVSARPYHPYLMDIDKANESRMSWSDDEQLPPYPQENGDHGLKDEKDSTDTDKDSDTDTHAESIIESFEEPLPNTVDRNRHGWTFKICERSFHRLTVFMSKDSIEKFNSFKAEPKGKDIQYDGIGVPLLFVKNHKFSIEKMITIYKYYVNKDTFQQKGFDPDTDYFQYCHVAQFSHAQYRTYVLEYTPDRNDRSLDFEIVLYCHYILPIIDYAYKGKFYRWIYGYSTKTSRYNYTNYLLEDNQDCIARNVDKTTNKIDFEKSKNNPLLRGYMKKLFTKRDRYPRDDYYSSVKIGTLEEKRKRIRFGEYKQDTQFEIKDPNCNESKHTNYESINSVDQETLINLCMGIVIKRSEDIKKHRDEHKRRRKSFEAVNKNSLISI